MKYLVAVALAFTIATPSAFAYTEAERQSLLEAVRSRLVELIETADHPATHGFATVAGASIATEPDSLTVLIDQSHFAAFYGIDRNEAKDQCAANAADADNAGKKITCLYNDKMIFNGIVK